VVWAQRIGPALGAVAESTAGVVAGADAIAATNRAASRRA
jgi:hypothetical protein